MPFVCGKLPISESDYGLELRICWKIWVYPVLETLFLQALILLILRKFLQNEVPLDVIAWIYLEANMCQKNRGCKPENVESQWNLNEIILSAEYSMKNMASFLYKKDIRKDCLDVIHSAS